MPESGQGYHERLLDSTTLLDHLRREDFCRREDQKSCDLLKITDLSQQRSNEHSSTGSLVAACFFIFLAISTWISEIELTRYILDSNNQQSGYNNPYAMMWMSHNLYIPFGFGMSFLFSSFSKRDIRGGDIQSSSSDGISTWESIVSRATPALQLSRTTRRNVANAADFKYFNVNFVDRVRM